MRLSGRLIVYDMIGPLLTDVGNYFGEATGNLPYLRGFPNVSPRHHVFCGWKPLLDEVGTKLSGIWRFVHLCSLGARPPLALARVPKGLATVKGLEGFLKVFLSMQKRCCFSDMHRAFFGGKMDGLMENDGK